MGPRLQLTRARARPARADRQAERALQRALAAEAPAVVHSSDTLSMHALIAPADAEELARARFAPLDEAGPPGATVLLNTLRTWLTLHGSWDRTAAALQIHRNTVRHRLARITELLDVDLRDPDVRMELWFALHWLPGSP
ncbi:helix-turn-helix domain-containing protein [Streptomyces diastatochromogenes]|nr:helix-turn-helix domain-containing protein [Streptomyces diastatochromogenes]